MSNFLWNPMSTTGPASETILFQRQRSDLCDFQILPSAESRPSVVACNSTLADQHEP